MASTADNIRGTIILADQVYKTTDNKWIISGTYNNWWTADEFLHVPSGLVLYVRLLTDRIGLYHGAVVITRDEDDPRAPKAALTIPVKLPVGPEGVPVAEGRLILPGFKVLGPPIKDRPPGSIMVAHSKIRLVLGVGSDEPQEVAYSPLMVSFLGPPIGLESDHGAGPETDRSDG